MIECDLVRIIIDEHHDEQVIFLRETRGRRIFPIMIGIFEATVIDRILKERVAERPLTHDLIVNAVRALGGKIAAVRIDDFREDVFYAKIVIERPGAEEPLLVDARPSDAIALALHQKAPIHVAEKILDLLAKTE
jgi:bifunctional DNase/RNase